MKKAISLILALVMSLSLCACSGNPTGSNTPNPETSDNAGNKVSSEKIDESTQISTKEERIAEVNYTDDGRTLIRVAMQADIANEGVWLANDGKGRKYIIYSVYEPLFALDGLGGELVPCLAKSYERVDEYTYKIELYDYIHDTAGNPITAQDVVWSYETAREPKLRNLKCIESFTADDDYHLTLVMNSTDIALFERAMFQTHVVSQKAYEESGDEMKSQAVATGPYMITEWVEGSKVVLEKNPNYWQKPELMVNFEWANVDVVEFDIIPEQTQQLIGLETGKVDIVPGLTYEGAQSYMEGGENEEGYVVFEYLDQNARYIWYNCNEASPCADINLRKAIAYAIDAYGLLEGVLDGHGEVTIGCNSRFGDYQESWEELDYYFYNEELAKEYLSKSNYKGEKLIILTDTDEIDANCALMVQLYLENIGIKSELLSVDTSIMKTTRLDYTAWDITLSYAGSADYEAVQWRTTWDHNTTADGLLPNGILDEKLDELLAVVRDVNTFNEESVNDFMQYYQMEMCYEYKLITPNVFTIGRDWMETCVTDPSGWFLPGSCTYTWNE